MQIEQQIQAWITENGSFARGVELYQLAGLRRSLDRWQQALRRGVVMPGEREALRGELGDWVKGRLGEGEEGSGKSEVGSGKWEVERETPVEVQKLKEQARELRKRYSYLHAQLSVLPDGEDLYKVAKEIMEEVIPAEDRVWDAIRAWQKTGKLPVNAGTNDLVRETVRKYQRVEALRTKISRDAKKLEKEQDAAKRAALEKTLLKAQLEKQELEEELGLNT